MSAPNDSIAGRFGRHTDPDIIANFPERYLKSLIEETGQYSMGGPPRPEAFRQLINVISTLPRDSDGEIAALRRFVIDKMELNSVRFSQFDPSVDFARLDTQPGFEPPTRDDIQRLLQRIQDACGPN